MARKSLADDMEKALIREERNDQMLIGTFKGKGLRTINQVMSGLILEVQDKQKNMDLVISNYNDRVNRGLQSLAKLKGDQQKKRNDWLKEITKFKDTELTNEDWLYGRYWNLKPEVVQEHFFGDFIKDIKRVHDKILNADYLFKKRAKIDEIKILENSVYANKEALTGLYNASQAISNSAKALKDLQEFDENNFKNGVYDNAMKHVSKNEEILNSVDEFEKELKNLQSSQK